MGYLCKSLFKKESVRSGRTVLLSLFIKLKEMHMTVKISKNNEADIHTMKILERILDSRLRNELHIVKEQSGLMSMSSQPLMLPFRLCN